MKISENFKRQEFDCKDGTPYPAEWIEPRLKPLVHDLEIIRDEINKNTIKKSGLKITSAYRTYKYNKKVGGALFSEHTQGIAVDIQSALSSFIVHKIILKLIKEKKIKDGGVGLYPTWVHYDHGRPRRW